MGAESSRSKDDPQVSTAYTGASRSVGSEMYLIAVRFLDDRNSELSAESWYLSAKMDFGNVR